MRLSGTIVYPSASIGLACFPDRGVTPKHLLERADHAMYKAMRTGGPQIATV